MPLSNEKMKQVIRLRAAALQLIDDLEKNIELTTKTEGIFRVGGSVTERENLNKKILAGKALDLDKVDIHVKTDLLKQVLRQLKTQGEPIFSKDQWTAFNAIAVTETDYSALINTEMKKQLENRVMPAINNTIFTRLHSLMHQINDCSTINKMGLSNLSKVIAPNIAAETGEESDTLEQLTRINKTNSIFEVLASSQDLPKMTAPYKEMIEKIQRDIEQKDWNVGFFGGVKLAMPPGETKVVPHRVAQIYERIKNGDYDEATYNAIKKIAEEAILNPRRAQKTDTFDFYCGLVNDNYARTVMPTATTDTREITSDYRSIVHERVNSLTEDSSPVMEDRDAPQQNL